MDNSSLLRGRYFSVSVSRFSSCNMVLENFQNFECAAQLDICKRPTTMCRQTEKEKSKIWQFNKANSLGNALLNVARRQSAIDVVSVIHDSRRRVEEFLEMDKKTVVNAALTRIVSIEAGFSLSTTAGLLLKPR